MSGIVGLLNLNGAPADPELLGRMTASLDFGGTGASNVWVRGAAGLGHVPLTATSDRPQPCSLDGEVWVTADARVDARDELVAGLAGRGEHVEPDATDAELILHAYRAWGEACVDHLLGDFAFLIWDGRNRTLFGARDHFGVKPFFYARLTDALVVSNALDCVRLHPEVSDKLNDQAIGDFLLFDANQDPATTSFEDIQRLPAAHTLTWSEGRLQVRRYWTLPVDDELRYERASDYVEHFWELLKTAVADRIRSDRIGIFMSGGLDSSAVAAAAQQVRSQGSRSFELRAHTCVYDKLIPDRERHYSGLVARSLGIPIDYLVGDEYRLYERSDSPELCTPEPSHNPLYALTIDSYRQAAASAHVVLSGNGPDALFRFPMQPHLIGCIRKRNWHGLVADARHWILAHRRLPRLNIRARLRRLTGMPPYSSPYPTWLKPMFEARLGLRERWAALDNDRPLPVHPGRPEAYQLVTYPYWPGVFESDSPGVTRLAIVVSYPFFDLRVARYLLSVPPIPWCLNKTLLRDALRGILPDAVRRRPKTPLAGDPIKARYLRNDRPAIRHLELAPAFDDYVDSKLYMDQRFAVSSLWTAFRPYSFNRWLQSLQPVPSSLLKETCRAES